MAAFKPNGKTRVVEREAAVIRFLLNHPESTSQEVYVGTGFYVTESQRFLTSKVGPKRVRVYSVNDLRYRRFLRTGKITGKKERQHWSFREGEDL